MDGKIGQMLEYTVIYIPFVSFICLKFWQFFSCTCWPNKRHCFFFPAIGHLMVISYPSSVQIFQNTAFLYVVVFITELFRIWVMRSFMWVRAFKALIKQIALHENLWTTVPILLWLVEKIPWGEIGKCCSLWTAKYSLHDAGSCNLSGYCFQEMLST